MSQIVHQCVTDLIVEHLQMVHRLRKSKEAFLTFADAKAAIQAASHKPFTVSFTILQILRI